MSRYQALADELESKIRDKSVRTISVETDRKTGEETEVWVALEDRGQFDAVCTIAHDHGFTPNGIINVNGPAARFKPRTDTDTTV